MGSVLIEAGAVETAPGVWTEIGRVQVRAGDVVLPHPDGLDVPAPTTEETADVDR
jgi:hypothetical protein